MERYPHSWIGRLKIVEMSDLFNLIYKVSTVTIKIPASYFLDVENDSKVNMET